MHKQPKIRKGNIVATALELAVELHYNRVTRIIVAERLQVPLSEIEKHFGAALP